MTLKCGEILCHSSKSFTILCTFCNLKLFDFNDFTLHMKNIHFDANGLLKSELTQYLPSSACDAAADKRRHESIANDHSFDWQRPNGVHCDVDDYDNLDDDDDDFEDDEVTDIRLMAPCAVSKRAVDTTSTTDDIEDLISPTQDAHDDESDSSWHKEDYSSDSDSANEVASHTNNADDFSGQQQVVEEGKQQMDCISDNVTATKPICSTKAKSSKMKTTIGRKAIAQKVANNKDDDNNGDKQRTLFKCPECPKTYKSYATMCAHKQREHVPPTPLNAEGGSDGGVNAKCKCTECDAIFKSMQATTMHQLQEHGGIKCSMCEKKYKTRRLLRAHTYKHSGVRNFKCDLPGCDKSFYDPRSLSVHKRNTHNNRTKFICDICGYTCRLRDSLRVHYRSHTGEKPYACTLCERRFASSALLKEHAPMHSTERPHVCNVCGANFARRKALYHHSFLHLGEKKFKCKICGNAYAQLSGLAGHMRKHKESMPV